MKSVIFTLADSVNMYEGGKLVISGTFDKILSPDVPFTFRPFGIAIKIAGEKGDFGKNHEAELIIRKKGSSKNILQQPINIQFKKPSKTVELAHAILAYSIMSINFDEFGVHVIELHVKNTSGRKKILTSIDFIIEKQEVPQVTTPKKKATKKRKK